MPAHTERFPLWLDRQLTEREWKAQDLAAAAGVNSSLVHRWRKGYQPNVGNARLLARTLGVPLLEVLIACDILTEGEAEASVTTTPSVTDFETTELTRELHRRAERAEERDRVEQATLSQVSRWAERAPSELARTLHRGFQRSRSASVQPMPAEAGSRTMVDEEGNQYVLRPVTDE